MKKLAFVFNTSTKELEVWSFKRWIPLSQLKAISEFYEENKCALEIAEIDGRKLCEKNN